MIEIIILLLLILIIFLAIKKQNCTEGFENIKSNKLTFVEEFELKKLLRIARDNFDQNNIQYAITYSTLMGALVYKNIIPNDDSAYMLILDNDENKLQNINWDASDCVLRKVGSSYKLSFKNENRAYPSVIINILSKKGNKYVYRNSHDFLSENELFPLKKYQFGDLLLNGPNSTKDRYVVNDFQYL